VLFEPYSLPEREHDVCAWYSPGFPISSCALPAIYVIVLYVSKCKE
jgi:hypothetical protein